MERPRHCSSSPRKGTLRYHLCVGPEPSPEDCGDFGPSTLTSSMGLDCGRDDNTSWVRALHDTDKVKEFWIF